MRNVFIPVFSFLLIVFVSFNILGCQPTYPKENLAQSVIDLCKREYEVDVKVELISKTLAIYLPITGLFDVTFNVSEKARDHIMNVILSASRVALSTDADVGFYCVIAQDVRLPELQVIIIKYTEDVKRAYYMDISRGEYFKRMLIDMVANPQAKKEESIKKVFNKFKIEEEWQEEILEDFFRTTPIHIKDMGYWQNRFYVKDITLEEFLAEQMAYRIKLHFRDDEVLYSAFLVKSVDSRHIRQEGKIFFNVKFDIKERRPSPDTGKKSREIFKNVFSEIGDTVYGYKFDEFDFVRIWNLDDNLKLIVSREDLYAFKRKKLALDTILATVH